MASSNVKYTATGSVSTFAVPFPYLSQDHVVVTVNGATVVFTWPTSATIQFTVMPTAGALIVIQRVTPAAPLFNAADGSILTSAALTTLALQTIYIAQEAADIAAAVSGLITGPTGATGATGAAGTPGGATGATGATGAAGTNGPNGSTGATGAAGTNGTNGTNGAAWSSGTAAASGGNNGDFYLRTSTGDISTKSAGVWSVVASLMIVGGNKLISGTRSLTASTGSVSYTGVGFKPSSVFFTGSNQGVVSNFVTFMDAARAAGGLENLGSGSFGTTAAFTVGVGPNNQSLVLTSYDTDGFTGTWTLNGSPTGTDITFYALCYR